MMKKIVFLIVLCASTVNAADLLDDITDIRTFIRLELGYDSASSGPMSDGHLDLYTRIAVVVVNPLIQGMTIIDSNQTLSVNVNRYAIDTTMVNVLSVEMKAADSVVAFVYIPREVWYQQQRTITSVANPWPSNYDYTDDNVFVFPTPTYSEVNNDTLMIVGVRKVLNLMVDDSLNVELKLIPQKYRYVIAEYATYRVARAIEHSMIQIIRQDLIDAARSVNIIFNKENQFATPPN